MFVGILLAQLLVQAQDDGAVARVSIAENLYESRLTQLANTFEQLERELGVEKLASVWLEGSVRAQETAISEVKDQIEKLSVPEADAAFRKVESLYSSVGSGSFKRVLRNALRTSVEPRVRLREIVEQVQKTNVRNGLARLLADYGGSVSNLFQAAAARAQRGDHSFQEPFGFTRGWITFVNSTAKSDSDFYANLFFSIFVTPGALSLDLMVFPFQTLYWIGYGVWSLFSTSTEEVREQNLRAEISALRARVQELESERDSIIRQPEGVIRR